MLIFFKRRKIFCLPKLYVHIQIGVENNSARFSIKDDSGCVPLGLKWASPPFFRGTDCVLNTDLLDWLNCFVLRKLKKKKKKSLGKKCWPWHESPITSADVRRTVFLNCCSVYCFPVWVLVICSNLFWLLSFGQIKAKWFYLMFYFLCFWPDLQVYDTVYVLGAFTCTLSSFTFAS